MLALFFDVSVPPLAMGNHRVIKKGQNKELISFREMPLLLSFALLAYHPLAHSVHLRIDKAPLSPDSGADDHSVYSASATTDLYGRESHGHATYAWVYVEGRVGIGGHGSYHN